MLHLNGPSFHQIKIQTPAGCVNHSSLSATAWAIFAGLTNQRPYRCYCTQLTSATLPNNGTFIIAGPHLCWRSSSDRLALFFNWAALFSSVLIWAVGSAPRIRSKGVSCWPVNSQENVYGIPVSTTVLQPNYKQWHNDCLQINQIILVSWWISLRYNKNFHHNQIPTLGVKSKLLTLSTE